MAPAASLVSIDTSACGAMAGAVVSCTVTRNEPVFVCSLESVAVQVTVVEPKLNRLPEAGVHSTGTLPSTRSTAVTENVTVAPLAEVASTVISAGRERIGASGSITFTKKLPSAVFSNLSEAGQVTRLLPIGNMLPDSGEQ